MTLGEVHGKATAVAMLIFTVIVGTGDLLYIVLMLAGGILVVLSDGVVTEQRTTDELLKKNGIFAQMAGLQTEGQNWAMRDKQTAFCRL